VKIRGGVGVHPADHHLLLPGSKLYCLVTVCEQLDHRSCMKEMDWEMEPVDCKSNA